MLTCLQLRPASMFVIHYINKKNLCCPIFILLYFSTYKIKMLFFFFFFFFFIHFFFFFLRSK